MLAQQVWTGDVSVHGGMVRSVDVLGIDDNFVLHEMSDLAQ